MIGSKDTKKKMNYFIDHTHLHFSMHQFDFIPSIQEFLSVISTLIP